MIFGIGVDIVEIPRMRGAVKKWGKDFIGKVFTEGEIAYSSARKAAPQHFAARFAAKEAVVKAFGEIKKYPFKWTEVEIVNDKEGKPCLTFHGDAAKWMKKKGVVGSMVSLSHSRNYAVASVVLLKK